MQTQGISRRRLIQGTALATGATFFGPWRHLHVYGQASAKPILIGLTHDASGQFANSGQDEQRGTIMAIEEAKFRAPVEPGCLLDLNVGFVQKRARVCKFWGKASVEGKVTCEVQFTAMIADPPS